MDSKRQDVSSKLAKCVRIVKAKRERLAIDEPLQA